MRLFLYLGRGLVIRVGVVGFCRLMFFGCFSLEGDRTAQQVNKFFDIAPSPLNIGGYIRVTYVHKCEKWGELWKCGRWEYRSRGRIHAMPSTKQTTD